MKKIIFCSFVSIAFLACDKKSELPCDVVTSTPTSLETVYGCTNTKYQMNIALNNTFKVIESQAEYNSLVTGSCTPNIDFNTYSLIIGKKGITTGLRNINYTLLKDCPNNKSVLNVTLQTDLTLSAPNVTYHALVPKLSVGEQVEVNVVVQ
jgi:hypothetical protein